MHLEVLLAVLDQEEDSVPIPTMHPIRCLEARTEDLGAPLPQVAASSVPPGPRIPHLGHQHLGPVTRLEAILIIPTRVAASSEAISHRGLGTPAKAMLSLAVVVLLAEDQDSEAQPVVDSGVQAAQLLEERFRLRKEQPTLHSLRLLKRIPVLTL